MIHYDRLIKRYAILIAELKRGEVPELDSYLNEMDGRQQLADAQLSFVQKKELSSLDAQFEDLTVESECVWGESNAIEEGWTEKKNPWYFRKPKIGFE